MADYSTNLRLAQMLLEQQGTINKLKVEREQLLIGVEVALLDHASELAGSDVDPNLAELAHRYLAVAGEAAATEVRDAMEAGDEEPAGTCRSVTVDLDGELVHTRVHGGQDMDDEERAAFGEVIKAARRRYASDHLEAARQRDEDVRAVAEACADVRDGGTPQPNRQFYAIQRLHARYADRINELERRDAARAANAVGEGQ